MPAWTSQDDVIIKVDNASNTLIDISAYVAQAALDVAINIGEFATLGDRWMNKSESTANATGSITLHGDVDVSGARRLMDDWTLHATNKAGNRSLQIQDPDASSGSHQYDCEVLPVNNNVVQKTAGEATPSQHQLQFSVNGAVTKSIIA